MNTTSQPSVRLLLSRPALLLLSVATFACSKGRDADAFGNFEAEEVTVLVAIGVRGVVEVDLR